VFIHSRSGTNIALDIPLRNPKGDTAIVDATERNKKRMKGIVLHILAADGDDGKIKIKWNKNRDKDKKMIKKTRKPMMKKAPDSFKNGTICASFITNKIDVFLTQ
jgi:hypothetical protein